MKKLFIVAAVVLGLTVTSAIGSMAADWRFPLGLAYISEFYDVVDLYEHNLEEEGYSVDTSWSLPVGLSFQPYVQLENGVRIGAGIGPISTILGDSSYYDLPLNITAGYTFFPNADISPYVRLGGSYHVAGGDYVESVSPGILAGAGVEFKRNSRLGFGVDFSYDSSEIEFEVYHYRYYGWYDSYTTWKTNPNKYMLTVFVTF